MTYVVLLALALPGVLDGDATPKSPSDLETLVRKWTVAVAPSSPENEAGARRWLAIDGEPTLGSGDGLVLRGRGAAGLGATDPTSLTAPRTSRLAGTPPRVVLARTAQSSVHPDLPRDRDSRNGRIVRMVGDAETPTPQTEKPAGLRFVKFGDLEITGVFECVGLEWLRGVQPRRHVELRTSFAGVTQDARVRVGEADTMLQSVAVGVVIEKFELSLTYLYDRVDVKGTAELALAGWGDIECTAEIQTGGLRLGRPIVGYDGRWLDVHVGASAEIRYLSVRYHDFEFRPDDPRAPSRSMSGSRSSDQIEVGYQAWLNLAYRIEDPSLDAFARVGVARYTGENDGLTLSVALGLVLRF